MSPNALAGMIWVGMHGVDTCCVFQWVEQRRTSPRCLICPTDCRSAAPPTAAGELAIAFDNKMRSIVNELGVQSHNRAALHNLLLVKKRLLQLGYSSVH